MHSLNYKIVIFLMGILLLFNGGLMLFSALTSFIVKDGVVFELTLSAFLVLSTGALMMLLEGNTINKYKEGKDILLLVLGGF